MNMKPFTLIGEIKLINRRIFSDGDECYGTAIANKNRFHIRLSNIGIETVDDFIDTTLHELLHLWLFILIAALTVTLSDAASHRIIDATVKTAMRCLRRELRFKRKRR